MPAPDRKRRLTAFAVAMAVLIATPLAVVAADAFNDVPDSNVHHDDIAWLADAEVTFGCNPPDNTEFCPGDPVLRQQMASFMRRLAENEVVDAATALTADEANHAATADAATTADSAATAGDADTLVGLSAEDLVNQSPLVIPAASFNQDGFGAHGDWTFGWSSGSLTSGAPSCVQAPVKLPNGSEITQVRVFVQDTDGNSDGARFWTSSYFDGTTDGTPFVSPSPDAAIQALVLAEAAGTVIANSANHYWIGVCLQSGDSLHAARVDYGVADAALSGTSEEGTFGTPPAPSGDSNAPH